MCSILVISTPLYAGESYAGESVDYAKQAGFVPHKALYDIKLKETKSGSQIVNISGQMFYEWEATCDAWVSNHRFNLAYEYVDNPSMRITSDFSIYEPFDRKSMSFTSQRKRDAQLFEEMRGRAVLDKNGGGKVIYSRPKGLEFELPQGTMFPMAHSLNMLEKIKAGQKFYSSTIFDGSDSDGPVEINAFIGGSINALANIKASPEIDMALVNVPAHKIRLAFFPLNDESEMADYEMEIVFHENGVISDMFIEYADFSVRQNLVALEMLENSCDLAE
ncbi:MAG: cell envelope integrity EipB family protein [Alphaproteobacteria bacterium]|nr:cell envelope integrity EipB family protein [Alphaproteobacteria bacterium]